MNRTEELPPSLPHTAQFSSFGVPSGHLGPISGPTMTISGDQWAQTPSNSAYPSSSTTSSANTNGYMHESTFTDHLNLSEFSDSFGLFADDSDIGSMVSIGQSFSSFQSESASSPSQDDDILEAILRENGLLPPAQSAPVPAAAPVHISPQQQQQYSQSQQYSQFIFDPSLSSHQSQQQHQHHQQQQLFYTQSAMPIPSQHQVQHQQQQTMQYSAPIMAMQQQHHHQQQQQHQSISSPPNTLQSYTVNPMYDGSQFMSQPQTQGPAPPQIQPNPLPPPPPSQNAQQFVPSNGPTTTTSASDLLSSAISSHLSSADFDSFGDSAILKNILDTDLTNGGSGGVSASDMLYFDSMVPMDSSSSNSSSTNAYSLSTTTEYSSYGPTASFYSPQQSQPQSLPQQQSQQTSLPIAIVQPQSSHYPVMSNSNSSWPQNTAPIPAQQQHKSPLSQLLFSTSQDTNSSSNSGGSDQSKSPQPVGPPPRKSALLALLESEMSPPSSPPRPFSPIHNSAPFNSSSALSSTLNTTALNSTKKF